ncbi:MAG: hypothetical protein WAW87_03950 [Candidatus Ferrigenium altingense]
MKNKNQMYVLGMICRHVWPGVADVPNPTLNAVLIQPLTGLALITQSKAARDCDQDILGDLINRLPADLSNPPVGVKLEDQGPFWIGYYHFLSAIDHAKKLNAEHLRKCGEVLFGDRWQTDLADSLALSDARRIRQWLSGDRPIPPTVWADIAGLLRQRQIMISTVLPDLQKNPSK